MRKKPVIILFFIVAIYGVGYSIDFGFKSNACIVKMEENKYLPDYTGNFDTIFFISESLNFKNAFLSVKPGLRLIDNEKYFNFEEIKGSLLFDNAGISIGKYNNYWGQSVILNNYFPFTESINPSIDKLWRADCNLFITNWTVGAGAFLDTKAIDTYKSPGWQSYYLKTEYGHRMFMTGLMCNLFNEKQSDYYVKFTGEFLLNYFTDITMYVDGSYETKVKDLQNLNENFSFVSGLSYSRIFNVLQLYFMVEGGLKKNKGLGSFLMSLDFLNTLQVCTQVMYKEQQLRIIPEISISYEKFRINLTCVTDDFKKNKCIKTISMGVYYEF